MADDYTYDGTTGPPIVYNGYAIYADGTTVPVSNSDSSWYSNISPQLWSTLGGLGSSGLGMLNSYLSSQAQQDAIRQAQQMQTNVLGQQGALTQQQLQYFEPYRDLGMQGVMELTQMENPGYNFSQSPSGRYAFEQGLKQLNRGLASRGLLGGGQAVTSATDLAKGVASQDFETAYNRSLNKVKVGQGSAAAASPAFSNAQSYLGNYGNNQTSLDLASGQSRAGLYEGLANSVFNGLGAGTRMYDWLNR